MKLLITGGCKNGKSLYAQNLIKDLAEEGKKYYVATMKPYDHEDDRRILRHQQEREGWGFVTIEQPENIGELIQLCEKDSSVLLDSTTALLMNEMFLENGEIKKDAHEKIITELKLLCGHVKNIAVVSDWIYSDTQRYDAITEAYRYSLAQIDRALTKELDSLCEVCFGNLVFHKGGKKQ